MSASATSNGDRRAFGGYPNAGYPTAQPLSTAAGTSAYAAPVSARLVNAPMPSGERLPDPGEQASLSASVSSTGGPVLRKRLFDQNVSDWASRYRKHKQGLDQVTRDCDLLRSEVSKHQVEVNEQAQKLADLEDKHENHTLAKFAEAKSALEVAGQRKQQLALEVGEARKMKAQLAKECKLLKADYERKHSELARGAEMRDRLEQQLMSYTQQLNQAGSTVKAAMGRVGG
ncbi:unnamed protein product [Cladocopium goreaui]|uniref:Heat shock protein sti1-like n=1 Tax=Cladocopium goreaui TaxID=2562237 RepID=A0A9P1DIH7_9DINO|nr:unnamed protein product [Cladocopium goreaui]